MEKYYGLSKWHYCLLNAHANKFSVLSSCSIVCTARTLILNRLCFLGTAGYRIGFTNPPF